MDSASKRKAFSTSGPFSAFRLQLSLFKEKTKPDFLYRPTEDLAPTPVQGTPGAEGYSALLYLLLKHAISILFMGNPIL